MSCDAFSLVLKGLKFELMKPAGILVSSYMLLFIKMEALNLDKMKTIGLKLMWLPK